jgi:acyl carrier protein
VTNIRETIVTQISLIAKQQKKTLAPLRDDVALADTGLDSLCIAILVAALDDELDIDPFSTGKLSSFPVTLGDFITLYEHAAV